MGNKQIRNITLSALFVATSVVLSRFFSIHLSFFGPNTVRIGFGTAMIILSSIILGPFYGAIVGALSDVIGTTLFPMGPYFYGYTINGALYGLLPGILVYFNKNLPVFKKFINLIITVVSIILTIILFYVLFIADKSIFRSYQNKFTLAFCITIFIISLIILLSLTFLAWYFKQKHKNISLIILISILTDALINIPLAALWSHQLYSTTPYHYFFISRLIVVVLYLPIKVIFIYLLYYRLSKVWDL